MIPAAVITLRETLEASLVVGIILAYIARLHDRRYTLAVWLGVFVGICASFVIAVVMQLLIGDLTGTAEKIYEGSTMLLASGLLTWMILWMLGKRKSIRGDIQRKVEAHVQHEYIAGLFFLALVTTMREAIESVIFLKALIVHTHAGYQIFGGILGIVVAIVISYFLFRGIEVLPVKKFFTVTGVLLLFFGAGLFAHSIHEFQEGGFLPFLKTPLWNLNPPVLVEGSYPLMHDEGLIGSILSSLFGYSGDPTALELSGYAFYVGTVALLWRMRSRRTA